ncbi:peptide-methionine (S)-S-oxide reductase MsrA [Prochlorococcus marinus]|uniref:Peptide methionine sulfoxide reductase MsrA n=1 Tax=Prochlorococcus marinus XMU1408 TaxID=2213228 RepID=A0A318QXL0_PROMR|nr:peptide-methionine (S)-S-oxide reductase MsrA [Prochlorococcus marinus]MBW3042517.1 peptide-methionine (S)-S-oxide reductase [Prochlorococcus marinus str. XMU1408]PYE01245.1 peptide-methionine (S)-S-oxide reductase [Prochlorococcus marinus XMU1408]
MILMNKILRKIIVACMLLQIAIFCPFQALAESEEAIFAGGCFWCLEHDLEKLDGVVSAESGYSGGDLNNPTYENHSGHQEVVKVSFDSQVISYKDLLKQYWVNIDPFDNKGQFCDRGDSYKPVIFTSNQEQELDAKESQKNISVALNIPLDQLKVDIIDSKVFWLAENYHQDFAIKNPIKYKFYRTSCGRDNRLKKVWGEYRY